MTPMFKQIWDDELTKLEKAQYLKLARIDHIIKIVKGTSEFPKWADIESNNQQLIREILRIYIKIEPSRGKKIQKTSVNV